MIDLQVVEVTVTGELAGQYVANVFQFAGPLDEDAFITGSEGIEGWDWDYLAVIGDQFASASMGTFLEKWLAACPESYVVNTIKVRGVGYFAAEVAEEFVPLGSAAFVVAGDAISAREGLRTGELHSHMVAPGVTGLTPQARRQPKCFIPGASEDDIDAGVYSADLITALLDLGTWLSEIGFTVSSTTYKWCAVARTGSTILAELWVAITTTARVASYVWKQGRRRLPF